MNAECRRQNAEPARPIDEGLLNTYRDHYTAGVRTVLCDSLPPSTERAKAATETCLFFTCAIFCAENRIANQAIPQLMEAAMNRIIEVAGDLEQCN